MECFCSACFKKGPIDRAHIKSRGAGAGWEEHEFIILCRKCHILQGQLGFNKFIARFPHVKEILIDKGWEIVNIFGVKKIRRKT